MSKKDTPQSLQQARKRPLSPHLSIYRPQITSVLSIMHRFTGVILFAGVVLFAWWVIANVYGCGRCVNGLLFTDTGKVIWVLFTLALYYHLLNGIRHLCWDVGKGYALRTVTISGWLVLCGTVVLTVLTWAAPVIW